MESDSDSEEDYFTPKEVPAKKKMNPQSLPVQLTWKGVQIYFPSVVLTKDLKIIADEALKKRIAKESSSSSSRPSSIISTASGDDKRKPQSTSSSTIGSTKSSSSSKFMCGICRSPFRSEYALNCHANAHSNSDGIQRKYGPCKCGGRFTKKSQFVHHTRVCFVAKSAASAASRMEVDDVDVSPIRVKFEASELLNSSFELENSTLPPIEQESESEQVDYVVTPTGSDIHHDNSNADDWEGDNQIPVVTSISSIASNAMKCERCGNQFTLNIQFQHHKLHCARMCQGSATRRFGCKYCPWKFNSLNARNRHHRSHEGARPYQCSTCLERFIRKDYMIHHQATCTVNAPTFHTSLESNDNNVIKPENSSIEKKTEITEQVTASPGPELVSPSSSAFNIIKSGLEHLDNSSPSPGTFSGVRCEQCLRTFSAMRYLKQHICRPHKKSKNVSNNNGSNNTRSLIPMNLIMSSINDIVCPFCGVKFTKSSGRSKHMRTQHKCEKCGQDFLNPSDKMIHSQTCHEIPPPHESDLYAKYKCFICHETFFPTDLSRHVLICRGDDADKDDASTSSNNNESSNRLQISDKFKCDLCGEMFSDNMDLSRHCLNQHVLSHSKLKNQPPTKPNETLTPPTVSSSLPPVFKCKFPTCSVGNTFRMFSHEEDLWFHVDKKHKSVGNICCGQCGEAFETEELVVNHEERFHIAVGVAGAVTSSPKKRNNQDLEDSKESALAILSLDIARVLDTSADGSTPCVGPSRGIAQSVTKPIPSSSGPKTKIKSRILVPVSIPRLHLPVTVKKEVEAYQNLDEDNSHFEEDTMPNYTDNEIPEGFLSHMLVPEKVGKETLNPYVFISSECRALADSALEKAMHAENLNLPSVGEETVAFTCHVCSAVGVSRIFSTRSNYRVHLYYHRKTGRTILKTPSSTIPEADEYFCKICNNRKFTTRSNYLGHLKYHQQLKRRKGFDEPIPALRPSGLGRPDIPIQLEYTCSACEPSKTFKERKSYIIHLNYHEKVKRDQEKKIRRIQLMRPDIPVSTTGEYFCKTCDDRKFTNRISYIGHVQYHEKLLQLEGKDRPIALGPISKPKTSMFKDVPFSDVYTCEICENREFTERSAWINHLKYHQKIKADEGQDRPIASTPIGASRHLRRPDIPISDVYTCEKCEDKRTFTIRRDYLFHLNEHKRVQQKSLKSNWRRKPGPNSGWVAAIPFLDEYKCETCPNHVFANRGAYVGHIQYHRILEKRGLNRVILTKEEWIKRKNSHTQLIPDGQEKYECEICSDGRLFASKSSYISHLMYHEKLKRMGINRPLKKKWEKSTDNTIPESDSYTCTICENRTFANRFLYSAHLAYHKKIRLQEGKDRSIRTDWREWRKRNSASNQIPDALTYTCDICNDGREFTIKASYMMHMTYHKKRADQGLTGPLRKRGAYLRPDVPILDIYTCNRCDTPRTFEDRKAFVNHDNYHNIKEKKPKKIPRKRGRRSTSFELIPFQSVYICKQCIHLNKTFTDRKKYILHLNYHKKQNFTAQSEDNTRNYSWSSSTLQSMNYHDSHVSDFMTQQTSSREMLLLSGGNVVGKTENSSELDLEDKFCCTRCGSDTVFTSRERYEEHMKEHRAMKNKNFQCSICEKAFSNIWNLKSHAKTHTGEKNFVCGDCGMRFVENFQLQRHQANDCRKVPCKYTCHCGDKFHSVDGLEEHVKKDHTETKVSKIFRCYVCNDQFLQAFELDQHVRENHPVDYAEFMQHKLEKQQQRTEAAGSSQNPDEDYEDFEPLYPEVLMACEEGDEELSTCTVGGTIVFDKKEGEEDGQCISAAAAGATTAVDENENANEAAQEDEARTIGGAGWNFIPGLTGEIGDNDDDSESSYSEEEFTPESFEPEDVEVPEGTLGNPNPNNNVIPIDSSSFPHLTVSTGCPPAPKTRRRRQSVDEDWTPSGESVQDHDDDNNKRRKRSYAGDGQFRCGYCTKTSHRIAYIKTHSAIHVGLPFKYIDLTGQSPQPSKSKIVHTPNYASTSVVAPQPSAQTVRPLQYVRPQQIAPAPGQPMVATVSPLSVTMLVGRKSSADDGDGTRQKAAPHCSCIFEDTALGYHKRCTGETCKCYTKYKGCSDQCDCKRSCGNPYFRMKAPVPPSALPCSAALATLAGSPQVQAPVNVYSASTVLDVVNSTIEKAFHQPTNFTQSLNTVPSTSTLLFGDQPHNNSEQQIRTLGNVTGYANPPAASSSTETITLNSAPIEGQNNFSILAQSLTPNVLVNPVMANVQPIQNATLGGSRIIRISSLAPFTSAQLISSLTRANPTYSTSSNTFRVQVPTNGNNSPIYRIENQTNNVTQPQYLLATPIPTASAAESQASPSPQNNVPANNSMIYRCFCHQDFTTLTSFLIHQWNHNEEKLFLCPICKRQFSSVNFLILHAKKHVEVENIQMVPCPACDRLLASNQAELDQHFKSCHAALICDVCQKYCATLGQLTSHRLSHGVCSICGLTFFNQTAMRNHLARDHPNVNPTRIRIDPLPSSATASTSSHSSKLTTASISTGISGSNEPEVVTLIDLDDDDVTEITEISRPPSPEMPIIVSVAANYHENEKFP